MSRTRSLDNTTVLDQVGTVIHGSNTHTAQLYARGYYWQPGDTDQEWTSSADHPYGKVGTKGTITDEVSPGSYNPVSHTKEVWECPLRSVSSSGTLDSDARLSCSCDIIAGAAFAAGWGIDERPYMAPVSTLVAEAITQMDPSRIQKGQFNLPQFVGELRELRDSLGVRCGTFTSMLKDVRSTFLTGYVGFLQDGITFRDVINLGVKADLARKFAIEPMIQDIKNLLNQFGEITKVFDKLRNSEPFRVYGASRRSSGTSVSFSGYPYDRYSWGNERSYTHKVTTWAMVTYSDPLGALMSSDLRTMFTDLKRRRDVMLTLYGFNAPVRTAWELMPLSFIVDWFVDLGSWLDRFDGQLLELPYTVQDTGYSVKETADSSGWVQIHSGVYNSRLQDIEPAGLITGRLVKTTYQRFHQELDWDAASYAPPKVRVPSLGKLVTLLELITTWSGLVKPTPLMPSS